MRECSRHLVGAQLLFDGLGDPARRAGMQHIVVRHEGAADASGDPVDHRVGQHLVLREASFSKSPLQSLQRWNFSVSHAASPSGESFRASARVCGLRPWIMA